MPVKPIPERYNTVTSFLVLKDVPQFIEFAKKAFGAEELERFYDPADNVSVSHAEIKIGNSVIMLSEVTLASPQPVTGMFYVYVEDVDSIYKKAIDSGGESVREPQNQFYGDRVAGLKDKFGNFWWLATHIEDVSAEELEKRIKEKK